MDDTAFYRVRTKWAGSTADYLHRGFDTEKRYQQALQNLCRRYGGRVGEQTDERNGFIHLRFHDTPDGCPDEAWLPRFLLQLTVRPDYLREARDRDSMEAELDKIFGFD